MTPPHLSPEQRAENIRDEISSCLANCYLCEKHTKLIAAQIREAEREASKDYFDDEIARKTVYLEGFNAALKKAAEIADAIAIRFDEEGKCDDAKEIAERIRALTP